jgi:hypothetical protein
MLMTGIVYSTAGPIRKSNEFVGSEIIATAIMKHTVSWDWTQCNRVEFYLHFGVI